MLRKTSASAGLVIVTAAGALLASSPAYALDSLAQGVHVRSHHRSHHRNRNWNGNRHHARIYIRIYIYNKNNNHAVAVARPERRRRPFVRDEVAPAVAVPEPAVAAPREEPARTAVRDVPPAPAPAPAVAPDSAPAVAPAETNQAPASTTPSQPAPEVPAATPASVPLDEAATG